MNKKIVLSCIIYWVVYSMIFVILYMISYYTYIAFLNKLSWESIQGGMGGYILVLMRTLVFIFLLCLLYFSPILLIFPTIFWFLKMNWCSINRKTLFAFTQIANIVSIYIFHYYLSELHYLEWSGLNDYMYFIFAIIGAITALIATQIVFISKKKLVVNF